MREESWRWSHDPSCWKKIKICCRRILCTTMCYCNMIHLFLSCWSVRTNQSCPSKAVAAHFGPVFCPIKSKWVMSLSSVLIAARCQWIIRSFHHWVQNEGPIPLPKVEHINICHLIPVPPWVQLRTVSQYFADPSVIQVFRSWPAVFRFKVPRGHILDIRLLHRWGE